MSRYLSLAWASGAASHRLSCVVSALGYEGCGHRALAALHGACRHLLVAKTWRTQTPRCAGPDKGPEGIASHEGPIVPPVLTQYITKRSEALDQLGVSHHSITLFDVAVGSIVPTLATTRWCQSSAPHCRSTHPDRRRVDHGSRRHRAGTGAGTAGREQGSGQGAHFSSAMIGRWSPG